MFKILRITWEILKLHCQKKRFTSCSHMKYFDSLPNKIPTNRNKKLRKQFEYSASNSMGNKCPHCRWQTCMTQWFSHFSACEILQSHHVVIKQFLLLGLAAEYRYWWWVWTTVVGRPSKVYDTQRQTKHKVPETIRNSTEMLAHQNLHGSHDLTTPLSGMVCHRGLAVASCYCQPTYQIWSLCLHLLQRYETRYKMSKMECFGVVRVTQGH